MAFWPKEKSSECHRPMVASEREGGKKCIPTWIGVSTCGGRNMRKFFISLSGSVTTPALNFFFYMVKIVHELLAVERIGGKIRNPIEPWERENEWVAVESSLPFEFQWLAIASAILITIQETPRDFSCRSEKLFAKFEIENFSRLSSSYLCDAVSALAALSAPWKYGVCEGRTENLW